MLTAAAFVNAALLLQKPHQFIQRLILGDAVERPAFPALGNQVDRHQATEVVGQRGARYLQRKLNFSDWDPLVAAPDQVTKYLQAGRVAEFSQFLRGLFSLHGDS
mgnify:CR=1 FL=1